MSEKTRQLQLKPQLQLATLERLQPTFSNEEWLTLLRSIKTPDRMKRKEKYEKKFLSLSGWQKLLNLANSIQNQALTEYPQLHKIFLTCPNFNPQEVQKIDRVFINDTEYPDDTFDFLKSQFTSCEVVNVINLSDKILPIITDFIEQNPTGKIIIPGNGGRIALEAVRKKVNIDSKNLVFISPCRTLDAQNQAQVELSNQDMLCIFENINKSTPVLILDDVISSGATLKAICKQLNTFSEIQICALIARGRSQFPTGTKISIGLYVESESGKIPAINTLQNLLEEGQKADNSWKLIGKYGLREEFLSQVK